MPFENWVVEEIVTPSPALDARQVYIRLLEQMIDALKETKTVKLAADVDEEVHAVYALPTVIFAFLDTNSRVEGDEDGEKGQALMQLYCYRDRREFLKDFIRYGDEDYLKEFGLEKFVQPPTV